MILCTRALLVVGGTLQMMEVYNYNGDEVCCDCEHDNDDYDDDEGDENE